MSRESPIDILSDSDDGDCGDCGDSTVKHEDVPLTIKRESSAEEAAYPGLPQELRDQLIQADIKIEQLQKLLDLEKDRRTALMESALMRFARSEQGAAFKHEQVVKQKQVSERPVSRFGGLGSKSRAAREREKQLFAARSEAVKPAKATPPAPVCPRRRCRSEDEIFQPPGDDSIGDSRTQGVNAEESDSDVRDCGDCGDSTVLVKHEDVLHAIKRESAAEEAAYPGLPQELRNQLIQADTKVEQLQKLLDLEKDRRTALMESALMRFARSEHGAAFKHEQVVKQEQVLERPVSRFGGLGSKSRAARERKEQLFAARSEAVKSAKPTPSAPVRSRRRCRNVLSDDSEDEIFQPSEDDSIGVSRTQGVNAEESDSDVPMTGVRRSRQQPKSKTPAKEKTPRTRKAKKPKMTVEDLQSDDNTLHAYIPEPSQSGYIDMPEPPPHRVKRERSESDDDDLYSLPVAKPAAAAASASSNPGPSTTSTAITRARSASVSLIPPTTPWQAPTAWNEAIAASSEPLRKPYAHEFIQTWPPYSFQGGHGPVLPQRFTRKFLSKYLGGSAHNVRVKPAIAKMQEHNHRIEVYHCITPSWDPYLPTKPGAHGVRYMIAPPPDNKPRTGEEHGEPGLYAKIIPTFCRRAPCEWEYVGEYQVLQRPFLPGEHEAVPRIMKETWAKGIAGWRKGSKWGPEFLLERGLVKPGETADEQEVLKMIDDKVFTFEALIYECRGYSWDLQRWLEERWNEEAAKDLAIKEEDDDDE